MAASALTRSPAALTWPAGGANEIRRVPRGGMYYPDQARYAALAAERLRYRFRDLDNGNGYLFAVEHDGRRLTAGAGAVCCYPINNATAYTIARDKAHTKAVLREQGVATIPGRLFFASGARAALRNPGHELADAEAFASSLGLPVFCKPNTGSRGDFAEIVPDVAALRGYAQRLGDSHDSFLVEPVVRGTEWRVLVHDGTAVYCVRKGPPTLVGDGASSLAELLAAANAPLVGTGVSAAPDSVLAASGLPATRVPAAGAVVPLAGRRNLGALGGIEEIDTYTPAPLHAIAAAACRAVGLRLGAVDIFDMSSASDLSDLVVIEVNANPMLKALETSGHVEVILALWTSMLRETLES